MPFNEGCHRSGLESLRPAAAAGLSGGPENRARRLKGEIAYHSGTAAEDQVARHYARTGYSVAARRWRGRSGEIDLVFRGADGLVFTEVKCASTHAIAAERLSERQMRRIMSAASEFVAAEADGQDSVMRFDVALVDCQGRIDIVRDALGY